VDNSYERLFLNSLAERKSNHRWIQNIAKERKVIPDPIDDRKFQE